MYADAAVFASSRLKPARARHVTVEIDPYLMRANTSPASIPGTIPSKGAQAPSIASSTITLSSLPSAPSVLSPTTTSQTPSMSGNLLSGPLGSDSIINKKADPAQGLYQTCSTLRERLKDVHGFDEFFAEAIDRSPDDAEDPVTQLWNIFKLGSPLCYLFNASAPKVAIPDEFVHLRTDDVREQKKAAFQFLKGVRDEYPELQEDTFIITHLYSDDTNGFVKVTKTVSRLLDEIESKGLLMRRSTPVGGENGSQEKGPMSNRQRCVHELVETERKYVQDLENLQDYMNALQAAEVVSQDIIHEMFLNLNALIDFQRRLLIRLETNYHLPPEKQRWGKVFKAHEESFNVYEPYCANFASAQELAASEAQRLSKVKHPVSADARTGVSAFLIKPVQRICKYPLLLQSIIKNTDDKDVALKNEIQVGVDAIERVNARVNEAIRKAENKKHVEDLNDRVDDWKGHKLESLGELLLHGQFTIIKGDVKGDVEREYHIYLFESILLCCKELPPGKKANKTRKQTPATKNEKEKPMLQLKGRIYAKNVTHIVSMNKNGSYTLQIFWKGDTGIENFIIKHRNDESLNKWKTTMMNQYKLVHKNDTIASRLPDPSSTQFHWETVTRPEDEVRSREGGEYQTEEEQPGFNMSRSGSSSDLRQQWNTDPVIPAPHLPNSTRARLQSTGAMQTPPLTLNTQRLVSSPPNYSHFSPLAETPAGGPRASNGYPFPRQSTPNYEEQQARYPGGAPMQRSTSRENSLQPGQQTRMQRPSLPGMPPINPQVNAQQRSRSASSPQIRPPPTGPVPATPAIPSQYTQQYTAYHPGSPTSPQDGSTPSRHASPSSHQLRSQQRAHVPPQVKVRVSYGSDVFVIIVPYNISYEQLMNRIEHKVSICGGSASGPLKIRYQDEDGDFISMSSDDDVQMAFDVFCDASNGEGTVGIVTLTVVQ